MKLYSLRKNKRGSRKQNKADFFITYQTVLTESYIVSNLTANSCNLHVENMFPVCDYKQLNFLTFSNQARHLSSMHLR